MQSSIKYTYAKNKKPHLCGGKREKDFESAGYEHADFVDSDEEPNYQIATEDEEMEEDMKIVS